MHQTDSTCLSLSSLPLSALVTTHRYLEPPSPSRDERCCWFLRCRCPALSFFFFGAAVDASGLGAARSARKSALVIGFARGASAAPLPPSPSPPLSDMTGRRTEGNGRAPGEEVRRKCFGGKESDADFTKRRRVHSLFDQSISLSASLFPSRLSIHGNAAADQRTARERRLQNRRFVVDDFE